MAFHKSSYHAPAANTAAIVTLAAESQKGHRIHAIQWSYDAAPTAGGLTIAAGGATKLSVSISAAGPGFFSWGMNEHEGWQLENNMAVVVTLNAAGVAVTGKVNVQYS